MARPRVGPTGAHPDPESGRKPTHVAASNVRPLSRRGAKRAARAAIRDLADQTLALERGRPEPRRYALAYLASLSPRHLLYPPTSPADLAKLADSQADMLVGVIRAVLDGLGLSDEQWEHCSEIASDALRACTVPGWEP